MIAHGTSIGLVVFVGFFEHGERGPRLAQWLCDTHRNTVADPAHAAFSQRDIATAHRDHRVRLEFKHQRIADIEPHHPAQRQPRLIQHGIDANLRLSDFGREMAFPDRITAELFAHEHLEQHGADRLDRRVRQQQFDRSAAVFHIDAQTHQNRCVCGPGNRGKARIGLEPIDVELDRGQRLEGELGICQHDFDHALDEIGLDGGVGSPLDPDRALSATTAEQYVDD